MQPLLSKEHYALRAAKWFQVGSDKCLRDLEYMMQASWGTRISRTYAQAAAALLDGLTLNGPELDVLREMMKRHAA